MPAKFLFNKNDYFKNIYVALKKKNEKQGESFYLRYLQKKIKYTCN